MRLRTALDASMSLGDSVLYWLDRPKRQWIRETDVGIVGSPSPTPQAHDPHLTTRAKRALFPSTLFESGRMPIKAFPLAELPRGSTVVLHTSYLAPFVGSLRAAGAERVVVDVHDVVANAHFDDASFGPRAVRVVRKAYAASVRRRELRYLAEADSLLVAGWHDTIDLRARGIRAATWAPTGIASSTSVMPHTGVVRVGLIGNFQHSATIGAATALLASPLAVSPGCELVLAGVHSDGWARSANVTTLGSLPDIQMFYDEIHAVVVPVQNSSGMKCKLAEGMLAGKAVITTLQGAAGYPPCLNKHFVVARPSELTPEIVRSAIRNHDPGVTRDAFDAACGLSAAAETYATLLAACSEDA
jgi:hypothetical protein